MNDYERIEKVIRHLETRYLEQPSLSALAGVAGLSEFHFQRLFRKWAGITPKTFVSFLTASHAKELLAHSRDLLSASLETGLSGPGRLHDLMISVEAMSPGEFKSQGSGVAIGYGIHPSPFGPLLAACTDRGLCHLSFHDEITREGAIRELKQRWPKAAIRLDASRSASVVDRIFLGKSGGPIPLVLQGTPFQLKVWEALLRIPEGHVLAYSDIAKAIGAPGAARAVGTAIGRNTIAFLIPCHRVIRETGVIGDYRWGSVRKRAILAWESKARG